MVTKFTILNKPSLTLGSNKNSCEGTFWMIFDNPYFSGLTITTHVGQLIVE